jgi:hypothetical protein
LLVARIKGGTFKGYLVGADDGGLLVFFFEPSTASIDVMMPFWTNLRLNCGQGGECRASRYIQQLKRDMSSL